MLEKYKCSTPWLFSRFVRRREVSNSQEPTVPRVTDLSPYPPLPAIGSRQNSGLEAVSETPPSSADDRNSTQFPPPLIRQDTYVVCDPLVVKGPKPRRKFKRNEAWGGKRGSQTPKNTSGGTFFTISVDSSDDQSELTTNESEQDRWSKENNTNINFKNISDDMKRNSARNKANAQAYWVQC